MLAPSAKNSGRLVKHKTLGKGTYGTVYKATFFPIDPVTRPFTLNQPQQSDFGLAGSTTVAVKRNIVDSRASFLVPVRELSILTQLRYHPFIIKLKTISLGNPFASSSYHNASGHYRYHSAPLTPILDRTLRDDNLYFIFEEAAYDGHRFIYERNINYGYIKLAMTQMLLAMEYVHSKGIVHRDLKPSNFLWFRDGDQRSVKISDFGLSKYMTNQDTMTPRTVTAWYRAPEIVCYWKKYGSSIDMWSIGCIFYELITKQALFYKMPDDRITIFQTIYQTIPNKTVEDFIAIDKRGIFFKIYQKMKQYPKTIDWYSLLKLNSEQIQQFNQAGVSGAKNNGTYAQFIDLLAGLLEPHPDRRLTATQALNHDFFGDFRNYIEQTRRLHPPRPDPEPIIKVVDRYERRFGMSIAFSIYNHRCDLKWYSHRVLFQTIDIYDRYIQWMDETQRKTGYDPQRSPCPELPRNDIVLRFMVCLYLAVKLLTTTRISVSFEDILQPEFRTADYLSVAEVFETELIQQILQFRVYRPTIYEAADLLKKILTEREIRNILRIHGTVEGIEGQPSELLTKYLSGEITLPARYSTKSISPAQSDKSSQSDCPQKQPSCLSNDKSFRTISQLTNSVHQSDKILSPPSASTPIKNQITSAKKSKVKRSKFKPKSRQFTQPPTISTGQPAKQKITKTKNSIKFRPSSTNQAKIKLTTTEPVQPDPQFGHLDNQNSQPSGTSFNYQSNYPTESIGISKINHTPVDYYQEYPGNYNVEQRTLESKNLTPTGPVRPALRLVKLNQPSHLQPIANYYHLNQPAINGQSVASSVVPNMEINRLQPPHTRLVRMDEAGQCKIPLSSVNSLFK